MSIYNLKQLFAAKFILWVYEIKKLCNTFVPPEVFHEAHPKSCDYYI